MSRAEPTSGFDRSRALLMRLGRNFTSERLTDFIEQGVRDQLTLGTFLETLAEAATYFREEKRVKMRAQTMISLFPVSRPEPA